MKKHALLLVFCFLASFTHAQTKDSTAVETNISSQSKNASPQQKELGSWQKHRFTIKAGAFFPFNNTDVSIGSSNGDIGTNIDLEDNLGFSSFSSSFIAEINWRASRRSSFGLEYYYLGRNSTKTLEKDIHFGDNTYPAESTISANFNTQITRFYYGYAFISKPKIEVGALVGTHFLITDISLKLETNLTTSTEVKDNYDFVAPLPDLGLWGNFGIAERMNIFANANYFYIKTGEYTGNVFSYSLSFAYNLSENLGIELAYTGLNFELEKELQNKQSNLKWGYNGPSIKFAYSFGKPPKL